MRKLTILPKVQDFELDMIDKILEDTIPENVRIYIKQYGGSSILECCYTDPNGLEWELNQFNLFTDLFKLTKEFKEKGWGLKVPFAYDPGGWHFCLSFDKETYGKIIINRWTDHSPEEQFLVIANSFEEFINGLEKDDSNKEIETTKNTDKHITRKKIFKKGILHFDNILRAYEMKSNFDEGYEYGAVKISNDKCIIDISVDRYYPDLSIYFINPKTNKEYSYGMVMNQRKVFEKEAKPLIKSENENEKIETDLKDIAELMEKYCSDILSGDFTTLEKNV